MRSQQTLRKAEGEQNVGSKNYEVEWFQYTQNLRVAPLKTHTIFRTDNDEKSYADSRDFHRFSVFNPRTIFTSSQILMRRTTYGAQN